MTFDSKFTYKTKQFFNFNFVTPITNTYNETHKLNFINVLFTQLNSYHNLAL